MLPSAGLTNLLCNWFEVLTPVVGADTFDQFLCCQESCWFQNRPLAMDPPRFNGVEPGTLAGQWTDDQATAAVALDALVVSLALRHCLTILLRCQEAFSQIISNAFLP